MVVTSGVLSTSIPASGVITIYGKPEIQITLSTHISDGITTAQLTPPSSLSTSDFIDGYITEDENPIPVSGIGSREIYRS